MARRKSSGFLETLLKSAFGVGTTVHYRTDWLGRRQKVVKHHDTGKTKTYTHSDGFLFGGTTTRTSQNGRSIESGRIHKGWFGRVTEHAERDDGTKVERRYRSGLFMDRVTTTRTVTATAAVAAGRSPSAAAVVTASAWSIFQPSPAFAARVGAGGQGRRERLQALQR